MIFYLFTLLGAKETALIKTKKKNSCTHGAFLPLNEIIIVITLFYLILALVMFFIINMLAISQCVWNDCLGHNATKHQSSIFYLENYLERKYFI